MAHKAQKDFFQEVKNKFPNSFKNVDVVDFGSKDFNGSLKEFFTDSNYVGIDISEGKNVDVVSKAHLYQPDNQFDVVVSGEMLEHDEYWAQLPYLRYLLLQSSNYGTNPQRS